MQFVRQAGSDPSFLLKALSEASGELRRAFDGVPGWLMEKRGTGNDEDWCLLAIAAHVRQVELGVQEQLLMMLHRREPEIRHVDMDDIPLEADYVDEDEEALLEEFHYLRRRTAYTLWDIEERDWERGGLHPYRGRMTVLQIARELYQHDLEHLWQVRRMVEGMTSR